MNNFKHGSTTSVKKHPFIGFLIINKVLSLRHLSSVEHLIFRRHKLDS